AMHPAQLLDDVRARPQGQVVRIGQEYARAELPQLSWCDAFDAPSGADDAHVRRLNAAVRHVQHPSPRVAANSLVRDFEAKWRAQDRRKRVVSDDSRWPMTPFSDSSQPPMPIKDHKARLCTSICTPPR